MLMFTLNHAQGRARAGLAVTALLALLAVLTPAASADDFGIEPGSFTFAVSTTQAGAHPDLTTHFRLNNYVDGNGAAQVHGSLKDVHMDLPSGFIGDATAVPQCDPADLAAFACPATSQVGTLDVDVVFGAPVLIPGQVPLFNLKPARGSTTEFGAMILFVPAHLKVRVRSDGDYGLTTDLTDVSGSIPIGGAGVTLWGVPGAHTGGRQQALLTNPSSCGEQEPARVRVRDYQSPDRELTGESNTVDITGCEKLPPIEPKATIRPDHGGAGDTAGYDVDLDIPQIDNPNALATPAVKKIAIDFPAGTAISPGAADGLGSCSDAQLGVGTQAPVACPGASKIGTVSIDTPLLADPLEGAMYLGQPQPGDQFRLFLVAKGSGVTVKLRGSAVPDPSTGHITATFEGLPQLPFSHLHVHLKGGPRAILVNPTGCGTVSSSAAVTPFGGGAVGTAGDSFAVSGACAVPGLSPTLTAGMTNPVAGAFSPFVLQLKRGDGQKDIRSLNVDLPAGLIGKVAGLPLCPTAQALAGTCSDASRVGSVAVTVGTGSNPVTLPGSAYLTEGYGGPFGLSFVVPAKIGPFDFGNVVVRAKVKVDPLTGALRVETDDLPSIIAGIPLHYRSIAVNLDRSGFMLNPTSCAERQIVATVNGAGGATAAPATRFQVGDCAGLPLAPKLLMAFTGAKEHKRNGKPGLKFVLTQTAGQSNLRSVRVTLPSTVGLSLGLPTPCTLEQFGARSCPAASRLGTSTVWSPLLDAKLSGGVFLVAGDNGSLPRLGVLLEGQVPISLLSKVTITKKHVVTTFGAPDLAISRFELSLNPKTALTAAKELCGSGQKASVAIAGASGAKRTSRVPMPVAGCRKAKAKKANARR